MSDNPPSSLVKTGYFIVFLFSVAMLQYLSIFISVSSSVQPLVYVFAVAFVILILSSFYNLYSLSTSLIFLPFK